VIHPKIEATLKQRQARGEWRQKILLAAILILTAGRMAAAEAPASAPTALPLPASYDFRNPPQGIFDDEWMEIFMGGEKIGYVHQFFRREGDRIFSEQHQSMRVGRQDSVLDMKGVVQSEETLEGEARSFHSVTELASAPTVVDGKGDGKTFDVTMQTGNYHEQKQVTFPPGTLLAWGEERLARTKGFAPGTAFDFLTYDPSDDPFQPLPAKETIGPREKLTIHGNTIAAARVVTHVSSTTGTGGVDMITWVDGENRTIRITTPMGGMTIEMDIASKEQALADFIPKDIFAGSLIRLGQSLPADAASVTLRLSRKDNQPLALPPESLGEHSEVLPDGSVRMTLTHAGTPAASPPPIKDLTPYLTRNSFLDTSDPVLKKLAIEGGGEATSPMAMAHNLRKFVADYITKKDLSVGFATASETAQSHEGDCTEHAVLLAALGRIRGLPTRVVAGLVFLPEYDGQNNILGFHMWTQFYLDNQWVDYDATITDGVHPYWRLGFVATDLNDVSLSDFSMDLMGWLAEMKITVEKAPPAMGN
jgi:hypothetical protein